MKKIAIIIAILGIYMLPMMSQTILLEAENFAKTGGWKVDQQFMDIMQSPYLIAHGMGQPVEDATTSIHTHKTNNYQVYVRTYNWTSPWYKGAGAGAFTLSVNGKKLANKLGQNGHQWYWQYAGQIQLKKGENTITLHDLTGFNGRCDAICFVQDNQQTPSQYQLDQWRQNIKNKKIANAQLINADLVVVGAGMAGISTAITAARLGLKVALVHDRPILGGNNSSEIRVHLGGKIQLGRYPNLGNLLKEYGPTQEGNAMPEGHYEDQKKMDIVAAEPNIQLFTNTRINAVSTHQQQITSIRGEHTHTGECTTFQAPLFADCTGDAVVGALAGAHYRMGREAQHEFGEYLAPQQSDSMVMGTSVQWYAEKTNKTTTFPHFQYGMQFNDNNAEKVYKGEWTWETGMNQNQITDFEKIRDYGLLVVYANWSFLKNKSVDKKQFQQHQLRWVAYIGGKRESRRLLGDYILSLDDLTKNVYHEDASFTTSWSIDLHFPDSINTQLFPQQPFKADTRHTLIYPYDVPYRCLYSRNINNLFMAGRNISVTHVALGTVRVMRTTAMMGEVVGMAAAVCKKHHATPREVYQQYLRELQQLMTKGIGKQHLPNNQTYNEGGHLHTPPIVK